MEYFKWDESLKTGISKFDNDHLKEWLVNHIMKTVLRYGDFFKEQNNQ